MKKLLLSLGTALTLCFTSHAIDYVDWVDWDQVQHWAGDPNGENKCALVIDFQDEYQMSLVWGYRWNGTATGEDLIRAVASQSNALTVMIQYTGSMGSTLNGIGISRGREHLDYLKYDFDRAAIGGEVSFDYFSPNIAMGQDTAPGWDTPDMCQNAINRARTTGVIEHPLNAFMYGYPAYDYDYWQLEKGYQSYQYRWKSGWYEGYWSYWHGPNDYDYMSYSGLGMSSIVLTDGCINAWKYTPLNGGDSYGTMGGDLCMDLDYNLTDYDEQMHEAEKLQQPVDQSKVDFWVGSGEKTATVVFQFNDGKGPENLVYGYRWSGGWDDNLLNVVKAIAAADKRMTLNVEGSTIKITYDSNCNGSSLDNVDHTDTSNTWNCYVKREIDEDFAKISNSRWLNPNAVLILAHQPADVTTVDLPYLLYRPALDSDQIITLPETMDYALDDTGLAVPMFINLPEGATINTGFTWTRDTNITAVTSSMTTSNYMGKVSSYKNFKPTTGTVKVRGSYVPANSKTATYVNSNETALSLKLPVKPVTAVHYALESVESRLNRPVENAITFEPADATYTKMAYTSSNTRVASVNTTTGVVTAQKQAGETVITAKYDLDNNISSSYTLNTFLQNAVTDITFEGADENNVITLTPKEMTGLFPIFTPEDPDINDVTIKLIGNGTGRDSYIATMYQVNLWDENNTRTRPYELSGHRVGECTLTVTSGDAVGFTKTFTVRVVEPERESTIDYNTGTIMLNEEWYGHTNGGLNWISPDYDIVYQAYERENPGMSFGATSQYGIIYDDKLIVCSKQAVDGGDPLPGGGRVVVADAATLKRIGSINDIIWGDETRSQDGRAAVGAGAGKAYIGTNSGIYILDTNTVEITGKIAETGEDDGSDLNPGNTSGGLYSGQIGDMVLAGHHVFAICQSKGVFIIDIDTDQVVKFIADAAVQGITQSADGSVWYAVTTGGKPTEFVALDHNTLEEIKRVEVPAEIGSVTCGWGAWRSTQFTGAHSVNALFFSPGSSIANGGAGLIHRYDIDNDTFIPLAKVAGLPAHTPGKVQGAYGTIRYDDRTGEIIAGTTESNASGHYRWNWTHFIDAETGKILRSIELRPYYWFQAHAIFPDAHYPEMEEIDDITLKVDDNPVTVTLKATDRDNNDNNIRFHLLSQARTMDVTENPEPAQVTLNEDKLTITPQALGTQTIAIAVESNGRRVNHAINVSIQKSTDVDEITAVKEIVTDGKVISIKGYAGTTFDIVNIGGSVVDSFEAVTDNYSHRSSLANGVYIIVGNNGIAKKIIIK